MPRKSLHGRTCGVSRDGGRARALQPSHRSAALHLNFPCCPTTQGNPDFESKRRLGVVKRLGQKLSRSGARRPHQDVGR
ncbi:hypothetical protein XcyCFBP4188_02255 [Xanthomonas hortorum pv. cynarae]|nr:hypothetical protein XcyCFBP4188_02255 [Xanthomonas hortorum pv. cynarae]